MYNNNTNPYSTDPNLQPNQVQQSTGFNYGQPGYYQPPNPTYGQGYNDPYQQNYPPNNYQPNQIYGFNQPNPVSYQQPYQQPYQPVQQDSGSYPVQQNITIDRYRTSDQPVVASENMKRMLLFCSLFWLFVAIMLFIYS